MTKGGLRMKIYILSATYEKLTTTQAIHARDNFSAKVLSVHKINASRVADKRYCKGYVVLKNPEGKVIWELKEEQPNTKEVK